MRHSSCYSRLVQFDRVLTTFISFFGRNQIRYALIGGLAVHAWGRVRPTRDVDFAVDAIKEFFERHGLLELFNAIETQS
jgi:hypothetical protein